MRDLNTEKVAVVFISGSAGELDWILPILDHLLRKEFKIKIIFLSRHALKSVKENSLCNEFINQINDKIEIFSLGGYFFEKIERIGYLTYRGFLKLEVPKIPLLNYFFKFYFSFLKFLFLRKLPTEIKDFKDNKFLFFTEFPSLRRPRDKWIKENFKSSIFFYCPHSPHIYLEDLNKKYLEPDLIDTRKKNFLLMGHPGYFSIFNNEKELANLNLEKVFIGHPKYSNQWLGNFQNKAKEFRSSLPLRKTINILVISRGHGSYLDKTSHDNLVETTIKTIHELIPKYNLFVKRHPRETTSHWDDILKYYPSIQIVNDHILELATNADFVISFWSSGSMDCVLLGAPVIEYWDPIKNNKQQVFEKGSYTTIYRKLGIVLSSNSEKDLRNNILKLLDKGFKSDSQGMHAHFNDLISRSNNWDKKFNEILSAHKLIGN